MFGAEARIFFVTSGKDFSNPDLDIDVARGLVNQGVDRVVSSDLPSSRKMADVIKATVQATERMKTRGLRPKSSQEPQQAFKKRLEDAIRRETILLDNRDVVIVASPLVVKTIVDGSMHSNGATEEHKPGSVYIMRSLHIQGGGMPLRYELQFAPNQNASTGLRR